MGERFSILVTVQIRQLGPRGGDRGQGITLNQELAVDHLQFLEVARILESFHGLITNLRQPVQQETANDRA